MNVIFYLFSTVGYNNKMSAQLSAHPHLYRLIVWFEKEELLVQQLVMKVISDVPVHKRKRAPITVLIDDSLQSLWNSYNAGALSLETLLVRGKKKIDSIFRYLCMYYRYLH